MTDTIFFRLLDGVNRPSRLSDAVEALRGNGQMDNVHQANPRSFRQVPGSPFAYWATERMREMFVTLPRLKTNGRTAQTGASTKNDFRFLRAWWEVPSELAGRDRTATFDSGRWIPFAKGGAYSPFYSDYELVIDWANDGEVLKREISEYRGSRGWGYQWSAELSGYTFYFRPGLTWPRRTNGLSFRVLPRGCIFSEKGPVVFVQGDGEENLLGLLAVVNSRAFLSLVRMLLARVDLAQSYEIGLIQSMPIPNYTHSDKDALVEFSLKYIMAKREMDTTIETSHAYCLSALQRTEGATLQERLARWQERVASKEQLLMGYQQEIDEVAFRLYSIEGEDQRAIQESLSGGVDASISAEDDGAAEAEDADEATVVLDSGTLVADLLSYALGCVFGRWDTRIALESSLAPKLADPFAPLPVCSPGMLVGPEGRPAHKDGIASEEWMRARPDAITPPPEGSVQSPSIPDCEYPLAVDWDGILVDDPEHEDDLLRRVREVLDLLWGERVDSIEQEACELLGVKDLRTYFRSSRQFFDYHIKRYSKSRRKAPIYWLLQSPKRSYGLWLYYHRLDSDILFKALKNYVEPKVRLEESRLEEYEARRRSTGTGGREVKQAEKAVEKQEDLLYDLREFRDRLERAAKLHLHPDLNDGVVLNIAPLHELVPWKEAKSKWNELLSGKYEWSSIGKQLREKGIV